MTSEKKVSTSEKYRFTSENSKNMVIPNPTILVVIQVDTNLEIFLDTPSITVCASGNKGIPR